MIPGRIAESGDPDFTRRIEMAMTEWSSTDGLELIILDIPLPVEVIDEDEEFICEVPD